MAGGLARVYLATALVAWATVACGHGSNQNPTTPSTGGSAGIPGSYPAGTLVLRASPIDQSAILWITPLGNLNPPSHTLATDHIYFYIADPDANDSFVAKRTPFMAPGDGTVTTVLGGVGQESKIFVRQTSTFTYYLDHLILTTALSQGSKVTAGQVIGTSGAAYAVDLGVINDSLTLGFLNPSRYNSDTLHADAPLRYFEEPLRSQLYGRVERLGSDRDGRIDYDVAGRLVGNWFLGQTDGTPLVFVYDTYDPSRVLIAMSIAQGAFSIAATDPLPRDVSVASGKIRYALANASSGPRHHTDGIVGYLLVQMIDDTHVKWEMFFTNAPGAGTDFTSNARTYAR